MSVINSAVQLYSSTITTNVQNAVLGTPIVDSSSISMPFTPGTNYVATGTYLAYNTIASYNGVTLSGISLSGSPTTVVGLSGNTQYTVQVQTAVGGNTALSTSSPYYTLVQSVTLSSGSGYNVSGLLVDSSSIGVQYIAGINTGTSVFTESVYTGTGTTATFFSSVSGSLSNYAITGLSGSTNYVVNVKTTVGGNIAVTGNVAVITPVQGAYLVTPVTDSSSIALNFSTGKNSGTTIYTEYVTDVAKSTVFTVSGTSVNTLAIKNLSGNTVYNVSMTTYNVSGGTVTSYAPATPLTTAVEPPYGLTIGTATTTTIPINFYLANNNYTSQVVNIYTSSGAVFCVSSNTVYVPNQQYQLTLTGLTKATQYYIYGNVVLNNNNSLTGTSIMYPFSTTAGLAAMVLSGSTPNINGTTTAGYKVCVFNSTSGTYTVPYTLASVTTMYVLAVGGGGGGGCIGTNGRGNAGGGGIWINIY